MDSTSVTRLEVPPSAAEAPTLRSTLPPVDALAQTLPSVAPGSCVRSSFLGMLLPKEGPVPSRYELQEAVGKGGMGVVVSALDRDLARAVAVKQLRSSPPTASEVARFLREAQVTAQLEHPGVVPIHDVGRDEQGQFYYVMRLLRGGQTLRQLIDRLRAGDPAAHVAFSFERRVSIVQQVARILSYAHSRGVIHRDVKPENVMLGPYGEVYLIDWGLAKVTGIDAGAPPEAVPAELKTSETAAGAIAGTPLYMAPEQANGAEATPLSDVYSLGAVLHELLSLHHYLGDDRPENLQKLLHAVLTKKAVPAENYYDPMNGRVPRALSFACDRALAKRPEERFASAKALDDALEAWLEGDTPIVCPVTLQLWAMGRWKRILNRHPVPVAVVTVGTALAVIGSVVWAFVR